MSKTEYGVECDKMDRECEAFNDQQLINKQNIFIAWDCLQKLRKCGYEGNEINKWMREMPEAQDLRSSEDYYPALNSFYDKEVKALIVESC